MKERFRNKNIRDHINILLESRDETWEQVTDG